MPLPRYILYLSIDLRLMFFLSLYIEIAELIPDLCTNSVPTDCIYAENKNAPEFLKQRNLEPPSENHLHDKKFDLRV